MTEEKQNKELENQSNIEINDIRMIKDFRGMTFSKFQKSQVKKELLNNIYKGKLENTIYWSAELICSGNFMELWEIILQYMSKYIHIGNPKLPIYVSMRFDNFRDIIESGYIGNELSMRNNSKIRRIFAELLCILALSEKRHSFEQIKVSSDDYDMTTLSEKLKAPSIDYVRDVFKKGDPKELYIALNELTYNLSEDANNSVAVCYWIEWISEFDNLCKKRKEKCECDRREFAKVDSKYQKDVIWLVWHAILSRTSEAPDVIKKIIKSLLNLYCLKYTPAVKRRRKYLLYFGATLCCENRSININKPITNQSDKVLVENICKKVDVVYKQLKKNEEAPKTDYLFNNKIGGGKTNVQKTVDKLDQINKMGNMIIRSDA